MTGYEPQHVVVTTKQWGESAQSIIGMRVNDNELLIPAGAKISIECEAGEGITEVTVTFVAATIRFEGEHGPD